MIYIDFCIVWSEFDKRVGRCQKSYFKKTLFNKVLKIVSKVTLIRLQSKCKHIKMFPNVLSQSVYQRIEYLHVTTELFIVVLAFKHKYCTRRNSTTMFVSKTPC